MAVLAAVVVKSLQNMQVDMVYCRSLAVLQMLGLPK
jgi:hypothetical protein